MKTEKSKNPAEINQIRELSNRFAQREGRRPRIMIAEPKNDALQGSSRVKASIFADLGFDVDIAPSFENASDIVKQSLESDVHILHISLEENHEVIPNSIDEFQNYDYTDIKLVLSADVTEQDHSLLLKKGVVAIFPKHMSTSTVARELLETLLAG